MKVMPPGVSMLPTSALRALTASAWPKPLACAKAAPPITATDGRCAANSLASRSISAVATPVRFSTSGGENAGSPAAHPSTRAPARPAADAAASPSRMITWASPSANAPSVPGRTATHSSALAPVCETRGSICTNLARTPGCP